MKNPAILFTAPGIAELVEKPIEAVSGTRVLVKLAVSTISSGTERANITGDPNNNYHEHSTVAVFPRKGGYSSAGTVVAVGEAVTSVKPGDRVALSWSCHQLYNLMEERDVTRLSDGVSMEAAALFHIGTFPMGALRKCRLEIGESAIVMGQGVLGILAVQLLRAAGAVPVIAADLAADKREKALRLGADAALDPNAPDFAQTVQALTGGGARVGIEVTGFGRALDQILDGMAHYGRVALLGCTRSSDFTIDYYRKVHGPGITLIGAHTTARPEVESYPGWWTTRDDVAAIMKLHAAKRLDFAALVEETRSPLEAPEVYARLATGGPFPIVQFDWRKLEE